MKRKTTMILAVLLLMMLSGCGKDNSVSSEAIQTDAPHTFAGYPVVCLISDVSAQGLLSVYEALEPPTDGMIGIKLSETAESNFVWADLTEELIQSTGASTIENDGAGAEFASCDSTIFLTRFEPHSMASFCGTAAHLASISGQQDDSGDFTDDAEMQMKHLAEQGNTVAESLNDPVFYIAVLDHWSIGDFSYMRHFKQLIACCMALALLCCGCSVGDPGLSEPKDVTALPLAEQGEAAAEGFLDVPFGAWYAEATAWCREHNILTGTTFDADTAMTRATVADALYRAEGSPSVQESTRFSEGPAGSPYTATASWTPGDHVAVKLSTGEPGSNYLRTDLIGDLVKSLDNPTIVDCNTAYGGSRSNTAMHYQVAEDHG